MNPRTLYTLSGYLSLVMGVLAASTVFKMPLLFYGMFFAVLGFIFSGVNIFLNTKYQFETEKFSKGYFGMFLSSLPVIFLLVMIFRHRSS